MPLHHTTYPAPLLRDGLVPTLHELVFDFAQLGPQPLRDGDAPYPESSALVLVANVREAQEVESLWCPKSSRLPVLGGKPPKLDQARLLRVQFQSKCRESHSQVRQEPVRIAPILKADNGVVSVSHVD